MQYDLLLKKPKLTILIFTIITLIISLQAVNVVITSDIEVYMPSEQPSVQLLNKIRKEWPIDSLMIYIEANNVTDISSLKEMDSIETAMNPSEGVEDGVVYTASIASLIKDTNANIPVIGKDDIPNNQQYVNLLMKLIPDEMKNMLVSSDYENGIIIVTTTKDADVDTLLEENIYPIVESTHKIKAFPTGMLTLYKETIDWIMERVYNVGLISLLILLIVLYIFHRDMKTVLIIIAPVLYSVALTFGTMGLLPVEFAPTVVAVLPLLAALGVAYSLHMINYFMELVDRMKRRDAIKKTINTTGKAVFLSAITTIVGFASLLTSDMPPIENMGLAFFIGVLYCFISTMILIPCLLLVFYPKKRIEMKWNSLTNLTRYRKQILMILAMVSLISIASIPNVSTRTSVWEMMPSKMESHVFMREYSDKFNAGQSGVILVETPPEGILEPKLLEKLDEMEKIINTGVENASAYSIVDVVKRLNAGRIPKTKEEVKSVIDRLPEKYSVLMLNENFNKTLIYVEMPIMPVKETKRGVSSVNQIIRQYNGEIGEYGKISQLAGLAAITVELNEMLMRQQIQFMFISIILVYLCLLLVFRSFKYASFTMMPILLLLIWQPSMFVLLQIPLNISTMTVSSIAIGVGIDFAVHITERVREEVKRVSGLKAIKIALSRKSPSLAEATIALIGGSIPIFLMEYEMITQFIILTLFMLVFACISSILSLASVYSAGNGKLIEKIR
ncbi:MAG TPA: hypothetical protein ENI33_07705 [Thermoplasmatales archaeon]|nr:hypothetical protein [Thermoplasmatales archaeon]